MRIITCGGYYCTGSSAVTDLLTEFDEIYAFSDFEYRFLQDPDGVSDLEYNLIDNNHRHNTSEAIKRYIKYVKKSKSFGYAGGYKVFGDEFIRLSMEYVDRITEVKTKNWWHMDRINRGELFCIMDRGYSFIRRLLGGGLNNEKRYSLLENREEAYYSAISKEEFLEATRDYVDKVILSAIKENKPYVMVDQMVPPTNTERFVRYFNDVRIIIVERDPRDVFLYEEVRYQSGVIPTKNVEDYVKWFKITRKYSNPIYEDNEKVLRIQFEDMIFKYDEMVSLIADFIGISINNHKRVKEVFQPEKSINNVNLKKIIKGYEEQIKYIEENLPEYLYDFDKYAQPTPSHYKSNYEMRKNND